MILSKFTFRFEKRVNFLNLFGKLWVMEQQNVMEFFVRGNNVKFMANQET